MSAALKTNTFDWGKLGQFTLRAVLVVAAFGAVTANLLSSIGGHLVPLGLRQAQARGLHTKTRAALV